MHFVTYVREDWPGLCSRPETAAERMQMALAADDVEQSCWLTV